MNSEARYHVGRQRIPVVGAGCGRIAMASTERAKLASGFGIPFAQAVSLTELARDIRRTWPR